MPSAQVCGLYSKGTLVWIEDEDEVWKCCRLVQDYAPGSTELLVEDADDSSTPVTFKITDPKDPKLPALRNPDILIGANDLTSLSYLHEPAVLYNLRVRFLDQRAIYTWCGIVLVAVNPFSDLDIYGDETIRTYHDSANSGSTQLDPHIYAVAEDAYSKLERESRNQSLIVSGESGAGKTVSAKFAMRYFASIASAESTKDVSTLSSDSSNIENRVLASNPIMESIGNAKTTRNDNSSRFGKYIQIMFDPQSKTSIVGGNMRTYLLEKSRISKQSQGERNFHIFYQICSYARSRGLKDLMLYHASGFYPFQYLGSIEPSDSDDLSKFNEAMSILGFNERQQDLIYRIVAAVLHAGDIKFTQVSDEECRIELDDHHLITFCSLLGLDESATRQWLTHRVLRTGSSGSKEVIVTPVNQSSAESGRDALAKFIYERMFSWVVSLINKSLGVTKESLTSTFIGVLDIYGFEYFDVNSFEQFCINYANEVLQQQFNQHVFKLEQEEYVREGIDWTFISFTDNQPVIDLIEAKLGILSLLDEECKMPKGTNESWCQKLYDQLSVKFKDSFQKPKFRPGESFIIMHFADKVVYSVNGFLDKNRDTVWEEQIDLLRRSNCLESIFTNDFVNAGPVVKAPGKTRISASPAAPISPNKANSAKATVGTQFRESLTALMTILNSTTPHYVRCIKSNDEKAPFEFDNVRAIQQLRACGVLETIKISSNGFPSRWTYQDFANRYRVLLVGVQRFVKKKVESEGGPPVPLPRKLIRSGSSNISELRAICEQIVKLVYELQVYSQFKLPFEKKENIAPGSPNPYQFGKSKIFFRAGQVALLERIRTQRLRECAILIQKTVKGFIYRRRFLRQLHAAIIVQKWVRGYQARRYVDHMRRTKAATAIQTAWRRHAARQKYLKLRTTAIALQSRIRGLLARRRFLAMQKESATITIQRWWRGYKARKAYKGRIRQIVLVQSAVRRYFAKKQLKALKIEARSVQHVQQLNKGLERKIIELQQKLNEAMAGLKEAKSRQISMDETKALANKMEIELKNMKNMIGDKDNEIDKLNEELEKRDRYNAVLEKKLQEKLKVIEKLNEVNRQIENTFDLEAVKKAVAEKERTLTAQFELEKKIFREELESEKYAHQQLLRRYAALEDKLMSEEKSELNIDSGNERSPDVSTVSLMMRCTELEQENVKLKQEVQEMRQLMAQLSSSDQKQASETASSVLAQQCASMQQELDRTREEKTHLKTIVLGQETSISKSGDSEVIAAFKMIVKQLEREVETEKLRCNSLQGEITSLKKDNERQQQLLGIKMSSADAAGDPDSPSDFITKLNQENMILREKCDRLTDDNKRLHLESMRQKMREDNIENQNDEQTNGNMKNYLGMFKYNPQKEQFLLDTLITNLDPQTSLQFTPHLPAYIIFMCVRYIDEINDDVLVKSFLNNTLVAIKRVLKRAIAQQNVEVVILWLSNCIRLVTLLKQYSGEDPYGVLEESLKNFDLSEYRQLLSDIAIWTYQGLIKQSEERIQPLIVPAVLEYEGLASSGIYVQPKPRSGSVTDDNAPPSPSDKPVDDLTKELSYLHKVLVLHSVEPEIISQIFKQLFYFICAGALNNLLLRKDLCHWNKAMQIRFNLSALEQWCRELQIPKHNEIIEKLDPIIQATKLLQTKKTEEHIATIVEMCFRLSASQIIKILNLYTAGDEENISTTFMKKITKHLNDNRKEPATGSLLMDTKYNFALTIPYSPTDTDLRRVGLPPILLKKGFGTILTKI